MKNDPPTLEYLASRLEQVAEDVAFLRRVVEQIQGRGPAQPYHYEPRTFQSEK